MNADKITPPVEELQDDLHEEERDDAVIGVALRRSLVVLGLLLLIGAAVALWKLRPAPPRPVKETPLDLPAVRELPPLEVPSMPFTDVTNEAGITFRHESGAAGEKLLPETMGSGCAFFDYDNDDDPDLLLVNGQRWPWDPSSGPPALPALYQNDGSGSFTDVTHQAGLAISFYGTGTAVGDYDGDGDLDLFLAALGPNHLFRNDAGRFTDVTAKAGLAGDEETWSTSCGWFDYDNDGDLDLFVCNYLVWSREYDLAQNFQLHGGGRAYGRPQVFPGTFSYLYRNDGEAGFTEVSAEAGVQITNPATGVPAGKSLGVTFSDFDADGRLDVIVANDTVQNFLFHNEGGGTFREIGAISGVAFDSGGNARGAMGIDVSQFRGDDAIGVAIGNFSNEMTALYVADGPTMQFVDEAIPSGLGPQTRLELTFGVFFFDADLDGRLDLFAANGHLEEDINMVQPSQFYEQPPQLFWNAGAGQDTEFVPLKADKCGEDFRRPLVGRSASFADVDGDGDLDVVITASGGRPRLLRNDHQLGHHWLRLKLLSKGGHRDAIGSQVAVHVGDRVLQRTVMPTRSYLAQSELPLTFGLGEAEQVGLVQVTWPDGSTQELEGLEVDRLHAIEQE